MYLLQPHNRTNWNGHASLKLKPSRTVRNKKREYLNVNISEMETNSKNYIYTHMHACVRIPTYSTCGKGQEW